jgi:hypothetical protein
MSTIKKLEEQDLKNVQNLQTKFIEIISNLGRLSADKAIINEQLELIRQGETEWIDKLKELKKEEKTLLDSFVKKYGSGRLDLSSGELIID